MQDSPSQQPIGLILKKLDNALTKRSDAALQAHGLTRAKWQILNVIKSGATVQEVHKAMEPFLTTEQTDVLIKELEQKGWIVGAETITLTPDGAATLDEALASQNTVRHAVMAGISDDDYRSAMQVLNTMLTNLTE